MSLLKLSTKIPGNLMEEGTEEESAGSGLGVRV